MPNYKVTYFNVRGRAETARMLLKLAGQDFVDERLHGEEWQKRKPSTPMGQLPILEVDGEVISQSNAINRYLANQFGFAGKTPMEKARADMIVDCIEDAMKKTSPIFYGKDESKKEQLMKEFTEETTIPTLKILTSILEQNNGGNGFFVGDDITWADLVFLSLAYNIMSKFAKDVNLDEQFPKLAALNNRISAIPALAKWIEERPKTDI